MGSDCQFCGNLFHHKARSFTKRQSFNINQKIIVFKSWNIHISTKVDDTNMVRIKFVLLSRFTQQVVTQVGIANHNVAYCQIKLGWFLLFLWFECIDNELKICRTILVCLCDMAMKSKQFCIIHLYSFIGKQFLHIQTCAKHINLN